MNETTERRVEPEIPFAVEELFYSTTDRRGVVLNGNAVFLRVAGFASLSDVVGRPHNVIRHPDMPRAVFRLLWSYLQAGRPIAAYVKNRATDGRSYWVMALALPVDGGGTGDGRGAPTRTGYVSIRFKPTSPIFEQVRAVYAELLAVERAHEDREAGMAAAAERLGELLRGAGFASYDAFMQTALATEVASRQRLRSDRAVPVPDGPFVDDPLADDLVRAQSTLRQAGAQLHDLAEHVDTFLTFLQRLDARSTLLDLTSERIQLLAKNALLESCRMRSAGRGLAVVTDNLATYAKASQEVIGAINEGMASLAVTLRATAFSVSAARLQAEMGVSLAADAAALEASGGMDAATAARTKEDLDTFVRAFAAFTGQLLESLPANQETLRGLLRRGEQLAQALMMLLSVHVIGRVEAAQVAKGAYFPSLFEEVLVQLRAAETEMRDFSGSLGKLSDALPRFERASRRVNEAVEVLRGAPPLPVHRPLEAAPNAA